MYMVRSGPVNDGQDDRNPPPLFFGVDIEECSECGGHATPGELTGGLCEKCTPFECSEVLSPIEGFDELGLERSGDDLPPAWRRAACRSIALDIDLCPFDMSVLMDSLTTRGVRLA
jgi:hypothetical protein